MDDQSQHGPVWRLLGLFARLQIWTRVVAVCAVIGTIWGAVKAGLEFKAAFMSPAQTTSPAQTATALGSIKPPEVKRPEIPAHAPGPAAPTKRDAGVGPAPVMARSNLAKIDDLHVELALRKSRVEVDPKLSFNPDAASVTVLNQVDIGAMFIVKFKNGRHIRRISYTQPDGFALSAWPLEFEIAIGHPERDRTDWANAKVVMLQQELRRQVIAEFDPDVETVAIRLNKHGGGREVAVGKFFVE